jgi:hypothetical protein
MLAVAGAGKTTYLINKLNLDSRFLIVTYTKNNLANLRKAIIRKFGYEPNNITLFSYFEFLLRVCYKPFFKDLFKAQGVCWRMPDPETLKLKRDNPLFYLTCNRGYLYHNRIAKLCQMCHTDLIKARIEKYYDCFFFDEVQDLGGHDFNLVLDLIPKSKGYLFVGDFVQHTFETSNDGNTNKNLYVDYDKYIKKWIDAGISINTTTLSRSHRCSPTVCKFIQSNLGIPMDSHRTDITKIVLINDQENADRLYNDKHIVKLFYNESNKYFYNSINWGASKGMDDFEDICIILNATTQKAFQSSNLSSLPASTRNKFYVACTRAKGDIYFVPHKFIDKYRVR